MMKKRFYKILAAVSGFVLAIFCATAAEQDNTAPPKGAIILFNGKSTKQWVHRNSNKPCEWIVKDGYMEVKAKSGDIETKRKFTDFQLHVEFWLPKYPDDVKGQGRANGGVYLQSRYEIQVLDSYGLKELGGGDCAAIYGQKTPDKNAAKPPKEWQTYDITFRAPRFDKSGKLNEKARVTVVWNGVKVHDNVEINGPTGGGDPDVQNPGPIRLQDHGCPDRFRNIWIVPAK